MSKVSVHIVTYHSEAWIRACLEAIMSQSQPVEQIIVIDNASSDRTRDIVAEFGERVLWVANQENHGFAGGHNQAIEKMLQVQPCDYICVLNPDVILHEDYLLHLIAYMDNHPHIGSATGQLVRQADHGRIDSAGLVIRRNRRAFDRGSNDAAERWSQPAEVFGVSGAAAVYRVEMIRDISLQGEFYDSRFFAYKEDVDVAWRAQWLGWRAAYIPEARAYHERGWKEGERQQRPLFIRQHSYINRYRMMIKNDTLSAMFRHLMPLLAFELASLAYYMLREPQVLLAWRSLWRDRAQLRDHRRQLRSRGRSHQREVYRWFE